MHHRTISIIIRTPHKTEAIAAAYINGTKHWGHSFRLLFSDTAFFLQRTVFLVAFLLDAWLPKFCMNRNGNKVQQWYCHKSCCWCCYLSDWCLSFTLINIFWCCISMYVCIYIYKYINIYIYSISVCVCLRVGWIEWVKSLKYDFLNLFMGAPPFPIFDEIIRVHTIFSTTHLQK